MFLLYPTEQIGAKKSIHPDQHDTSELECSSKTTNSRYEEDVRPAKAKEIQQILTLDPIIEPEVSYSR